MKHKAVVSRREVFNAPLGWYLSETVECSCGKWSKAFGTMVIGDPTEQNVLALHKRHAKYHANKVVAT